MMPSTDFKRYLTLLILLLLSTLMLGYSQNIFAATPIAQVIWVKGSMAAVQPGASPRNLQRRSPVYEHDVIVTGGGSSGEIAFTDSGVVSLTGGSQFKIDEYHYDKSSGSGKTVVSLLKGGMRTITGAIPKQNPDAYQLNTPVATIGVRGTQYAGVLSPSKGLLLKIENGEIQVTNSAGKIQMKRCATGDTSPSCNLYGIISDSNSAPVSTQQMPPELANLPAATPASQDILNSITNTPAPGSSGGGGSGGGSKTVSSFCVGLLNDIYNKIFG